MGYNYLTSVPGTSPRSTGCTNRGTGFGRRSPRRPRRPAPPVGCCPCHRTLQRPRRVSRTAPWSAAEVGRRSGLPAALLLSILCGGRRSHPASSGRTLISVGCAFLNGEGSSTRTASLAAMRPVIVMWAPELEHFAVSQADFRCLRSHGGGPDADTFSPSWLSAVADARPIGGDRRAGYFGASEQVGCESSDQRMCGCGDQISVISSPTASNDRAAGCAIVGRRRRTYDRDLVTAAAHSLVGRL